MFPFENLKVYALVKSLNSDLYKLIVERNLSNYLKDQLGRASISIRLNIAEGASRISQKERRYFLCIARGSAFECISLLEFLREVKIITESDFESFYRKIDEISRILFIMSRNAGLRQRGNKERSTSLPV